MRKQSMNSQYIKWLVEIEGELSKFFRLFLPLCSKCFLHTDNQLEKKERRNRKFWCCCLIDNQIHDNWELINTIQKRFNTQWYKELSKDVVVKKRMPGNGPCPALGPSGCLIKKCRPMTCNTQVCEKMLYILNKTGMIRCEATIPLQIEEIVETPNILPILYGVKNDKSVTDQEVCEYKRVIKQLRTRFGCVPKEVRELLAEEALNFHFKIGRYKK